MDHQPSNLKAAFWMAGWLSAMLVMAIAGRETTRELDVFQIMEMRSILGLFMLYPLIHLGGGFTALKTARPWEHIGRNVAHYGAQFAWFVSLTLIPLAQVISIEFTMPIWTAILAVAFLAAWLIPKTPEGTWMRWAAWAALPIIVFLGARLIRGPRSSRLRRR